MTATREALAGLYPHLAQCTPARPAALDAAPVKDL